MSARTARIALVTGANKGIGFEAARGIAKAGYVVLLGARNPAAGRQAADTLTSERLDVRFVELDVTRMETISAAAARIEADFGKLDVLVNDAGITDPPDGPPSRVSIDVIDCAEHVHGPIGVRTEGSGYCGELGQSGLHGD